jgi:hypothetical protein
MGDGQIAGAAGTQAAAQPDRRPPAYFRAMRDDVEGRIYDIISRGVETAEILPYRVTPTGRQLHVFVHEGLPRGIVNAVPT